MGLYANIVEFNTIIFMNFVCSKLYSHNYVEFMYRCDKVHISFFRVIDNHWKIEE